jgi:hypothetical protein
LPLLRRAGLKMKGAQTCQKRPRPQHLWVASEANANREAFCIYRRATKPQHFTVQGKFSRSLQNLFKLRTHFCRVAKGDSYDRESRAKALNGKSDQEPPAGFL